MKVGRSDSRTPGKHHLLNRILGREAGAMAHTNILVDPWVVIDLCAGDGRPDDASGTCSPTIIAKHASYRRDRNGQVKVVLIERTKATHDALRENVEPHADTTILQADAREPWIVPTLWRENSPVFIHNDPNNINDFALSDNLVRRLPAFTTTLSTLGCNVGGLKRLDPAERQLWFDHARRVIQLMPRHHDGLMIALNGDDAQWAYLLTGPSKWRTQYEEDVNKAFARWPKGVTCKWFKDDPGGFDKMCSELFLTRTERASA
jgi:hypothetical protein